MAREGKVSRGSIYNYFEDRDELIVRIVKFGVAAWAHDADTAMVQDNTLEYQIIAGGWIARLWHQMEEKTPLLDCDYEHKFMDDLSVSHFPAEKGPFIMHLIDRRLHL